MTRQLWCSFIISSLFLTSCSNAEDAISEKMGESISTEVETMSMPTEGTPQGGNDESSKVTSNSGRYISLREYESTRSSHSNSDVVLFFNANWCSTCKLARDNFEKTLEEFPDNLTIVLVDFDSETDLKKEYGVLIQHTFVQISNSGKELAKWTGSITVKDVTDNLV